MTLNEIADEMRRVAEEHHATMFRLMREIREERHRIQVACGLAGHVFARDKVTCIVCDATPSKDAGPAQAAG